MSATEQWNLRILKLKCALPENSPPAKLTLKCPTPAAVKPDALRSALTKKNAAILSKTVPSPNTYKWEQGLQLVKPQRSLHRFNWTSKSDPM
ncbi:unnamed protein product [Cyprideis torosa]|uniref:Uncharacterized protein n=1 Tax=Cyprideis torosa TaxID=163714 RepID=A0A7R8ZPR8_9CRUS|nr:unnamed protein product [Cyprideis torosa]CAG0899551.1 unnamed protein product [Cyprideis torosa]